jgi:hypothetical protein
MPAVARCKPRIAHENDAGDHDVLNLHVQAHLQLPDTVLGRMFCGHAVKRALRSRKIPSKKTV